MVCENSPVATKANTTPAPEEVQKPALTVPSPMRSRKLEPSLQAWAASKRMPLQPCNVGPSEVPEKTDEGDEKQSSVRRGRDRTRREAQGISKSSSEKLLGERPQRFEWTKSLRAEEEPSQSDKPWHATVPNAPLLRTSMRSRSRSASSSRNWTPQGTPERRSSSRSATPLPKKEQEAVEQYLQRMTLARLGSPLRRRSKIAFGSSAEDRVAPSPARSESVDSRASSTSSISSRLSQLSQPRVLSKGLLSTEDLEVHQAEQEKRALRKQMRRNERSYRQAILLAETSSGLTQRNVERILTLPKGPELRTSSRSARHRSTSWHSDTLLSSRSRDGGTEIWGGLRQHPNAREQAAIEKHLTRAVAAASEKLSGSVAPLAAPKKEEASSETQKWIKEGATAEERAERARQAALARQDNNLAQERSKLFVFRSKGEEKKTATTADDATKQSAPSHVAGTAA
mmetsp:Transcript_30607/g.55482  ORF Transcript_30607/g.55482 Transcript_30607/m.55482 type:complete len:457 (-) Transcript_30607:127-1497(-)|eukprot:CAMPEP_0197621626 /NCGR_PEP_ID=MMETSP1338-20131121/2155_1 /TAXON_ID=43686 ORGANISM="Pelagodinium beii, Strain RCC1491" /NCGR_SAMPLE_ID=MMETSP1338 /ASSEMBLY_ACC=CAM_ASM_000754 /LENGTH=456 /DNA_ID=CAMNT_0043191141 /DNA_START=89 /DNA_END=1459 /DNA_ORIENTATION=-